jgi:hypothetical protein
MPLAFRKCEISAFAEAREQLPKLRRHFFDAPADEFMPFHSV